MQTITDLLIDISDNMSNKMQTAQNILSNEIVPALDFTAPIGMRTFLSVVKSPIIINSIDMGINSKEDVFDKINKLPIPNGGSPINAALEKSINYLKEQKDCKKQIIIVTNGNDTDLSEYHTSVLQSHSEI